MLTGLVGDWQFERIVSGQASMTGTAIVIERADGLLSYREQGRLDLAGSSYEFTRAYLYRDRASGFDVLFDEPEPRLFQSVDVELNAGLWVGTAQHRCRPDLYVSRYQLALSDRFEIVHQVSGPRKDYTSTTRFFRPGYAPT